VVVQLQRPNSTYLIIFMVMRRYSVAVILAVDVVLMLMLDGRAREGLCIYKGVV
jgi:hypothetical protein